jgi:hypothetical protein
VEAIPLAAVMARADAQSNGPGLCHSGLARSLGHRCLRRTMRDCRGPKRDPPSTVPLTIGRAGMAPCNCSRQERRARSKAAFAVGVSQLRSPPRRGGSPGPTQSVRTQSPV